MSTRPFPAKPLKTLAAGHQPLAEHLRPHTLGDGLMQQRTIGFVDEMPCFRKSVNAYIKQKLRGVVVQIIGLPHGSERWNHA